VDAAVLGRGATLSGEGRLATVTFRVLAAEDFELAFDGIRARGAANEDAAVDVVLNEIAVAVPELPQTTLLHPNAPNPFNPATKISFDLARTGRVSLRIYDLRGALVQTLVDEERPAGRYSTVWDGRDGTGRRVASGTYFLRLQTPDATQTRRMTMVK
jgi:hypothetical protein